MLNLHIEHRVVTNVKPSHRTLSSNQCLISGHMHNELVCDKSQINKNYYIKKI